jgi:flagellar basal body P-ring protein FlgI
MQMSRSVRGVVRFTVGCLLAAAVVGCGMQQKTRSGGPGTDPRDAIRASTYPALHETIGEYAALANASPTVVEGIGMVADLPNTGSSDMPPNVRALLLDSLYKMGAGSYTRGTQNISPERILSTSQVAAVEIRGIIPPLARKGSTFDLVVSALPNTQTTSLANGLLWTSELTLAGTSGQTHPIALGRGPVFIPGAVEKLAGAEGVPNGRETAAQRKVLRSGRIIGGGTVAEERPIQLQLYSPGLGKAQAVERAINAKFPSIDKVAVAENEALVTLNIPREYLSRPAEFIDMVRHIFLRQDVPGFNEQKATELIKALADRTAPHRDLSLALQGLGRSILPDYIQPQYTSADPTVRFWCGRAGAALQDVGGMVVLQSFVADVHSPYHDQAVRALAEVSRVDTVNATVALSDLLKSPDVDERVHAYQSLAAMGSRAVRHYTVGSNFYMDVLPSDSPPLIYVSQSGTQRIALIGRPIVLPAGALYISPDSQLTVNVSPETPGSAAAPGAAGNVLTAAVAGGDASPAAENRSENVTLFWRSPVSGKSVDLKTGADLPLVLARLGWTPNPRSPDYDPKAPFIGASYQRIVEMLAAMSKGGVIDAQFVLEKPAELPPTANDLVNEGRPEGTTATTRPSPAVAPMPPAEKVDDAAPVPAEAPLPNLVPLPQGN